MLPTPQITKNTTLVECSRLMIENDVLRLPVFKDGAPTGVVTAGNILHAVALMVFGDRKAVEFMSDDMIICSPDDPVGSITKRDILEKIHELLDRMDPAVIQVSSNIADFDKEIVSKAFRSFVNEHEKQFGNGHICTYFKVVGSEAKDNKRIQSRIHIDTSKIKTYITAEENDGGLLYKKMPGQPSQRDR